MVDKVGHAVLVSPVGHYANMRIKNRNVAALSLIDRVNVAR